MDSGLARAVRAPQVSRPDYPNAGSTGKTLLFAPKNAKDVFARMIIAIVRNQGPKGKRNGKRVVCRQRMGYDISQRRIEYVF